MNFILYVYRRPNMFIVNNNLFGNIGYGELEKLFTIENYSVESGKELTLYHPERFLNMVEQQLLVSRIESAGYGNVAIYTHSVQIVQTVHNENIRVIQDEIHDDDFKVSNDSVGIPKFEG